MRCLVAESREVVRMDFADNINSIISDLYEGILDQQSQNKALHHLAQLLGSEHVA